MNIEYLIKLEYVEYNIMMFSMQYREKDIALILLEDLNRHEIYEFDYDNSISQFKENDIDTRNLIHIVVFPLFSLLGNANNNDIKEKILYVAESLVENRGTMNIKLEWREDCKVSEAFGNRNASFDTLKTYLSEYCENEFSNKNNDMGHLFNLTE